MDSSQGQVCGDYVRKLWCFLTDLESLAQMDSQALRRAEPVNFAKKCIQAKYPIHLALYLDILQPIKVLSLKMQQEIHDPVVQLRYI